MPHAHVMEEIGMNRQREKQFVAILGFIIALIAIVLVAAPGLAYREHWLDLESAFGTLRWGTWLGLAAMIVSLIGAWLARPGQARRGFAGAIAGVVIGAFAFGLPFAFVLTAEHVPPIHDITTDTTSPPQFVAVLALRKDASNSAEYGGPDIAQQQRSAYPDIQPVMLAVPPAQAFNQALKAVRDMGWELVASAPNEGRIEATDTTLWFGFKDDIVIRVTVNGDASRVDVRSVSRVGRSDLGKNAHRVQAYLAKLRTSNS